MSNNLVIGYQNYLHDLAAAAVTADQAATNFPASNTRLVNRQIVWRTTDAATDHYVQMDLGSALAVSFAAILDPNIEDYQSGGYQAALQLRAADNAGFSSGVLNFGGTTHSRLTPTGSTAHIQQRVCCWSARTGTGTLLPQTKRYWRFQVINAKVPVVDVFTSFGKLFVGAAWQPPKNFLYGAKIEWVDMSWNRRAPQGASYGGRGNTYGRVAFELPLLPEADLGTLLGIFDVVGTHTPVWALFNEASNERHTLYCKFTERPRYVWRRSNLFDVSLAVEEEL